MKDTSAATERVGRYQLLEPIGGGPNGSVSRAKVFGVAGFERQFAVKRFSADLTVGPTAQALSSAARSYGSLEHPRIARMSEFGVAQGQTFTAVEYVAGLDVFRLLQEAKLAGVAIAAGGALALVSQASRAVGYAHGRGLSHLGLSPTNVIVTPDGDVKVTDFGILAATMPQRPAESSRLASRVPYLSPEQISGEATSAASDVFVLGVIAYELVTGQRAYRGETPAQVAQAILGGPPAEPPLPRPIVRVLQRCLARSPFERFPDARALADALDAALRVAPVPGTRKDVGAQVKTTLERYAQLNEGNLSGMVALNLVGAASQDNLGGATAIGLGGRSEGRPEARPEARTEPTELRPVSTRQEARTVPSAIPAAIAAATSGPASTSNPASTMREIPKPFATMPGLAPPPIPVPPGVSPPPTPMPMTPGAMNTLPGVAMKKPQVIPNIVPKAGAAGANKPAKPPALNAMASEPVFSLPEEEGEKQNTVLGLGGVAQGRASTRDEPFESTTGQMSTSQLDALNKRASETASDALIYIDPVDAGLDHQSVSLQEMNSVVTVQGDSIELAASVGALGDAADPDADADPHSRPTRESPPQPRPTPAPVQAPRPTPTSNATLLSTPTPAPRPTPTPMPVQMPAPLPLPAPEPTTAPPPTTTSSNKLPLIAGIVFGIGVIAAGGYVAYNELVLKKKNATVVANAGGSAKGSAADTGTRSVKAAGSAGSASMGSASMGSASAGSASAGSASAGSASAGSASAGSASAGSAGSAGSASAGSASAGSGGSASAGSGSAGSGDKGGEATKPSAPSDALQVTTKPAGARVFVDGADQGTAPVKIPGSADRHSLAVLLPGHDLYLADVDGHGVYDITLKPITPNGGQAGIKVIKCKDKERYYVYVDGNPTGMTCPTERIDTVVGPHTVEVYDVVTETRRKWDIVVKDERLSVRVKVE